MDHLSRLENDPAVTRRACWKQTLREIHNFKQYRDSLKNKKSLKADIWSSEPLSESWVGSSGTALGQGALFMLACQRDAQSMNN